MRLDEEIARARTNLLAMLNAAHVERLQGMTMAIVKDAADVAKRLLQEIGCSQVVPSADLRLDVVTNHSRGIFMDESMDQKQTVTVVLPSAVDIAARDLSRPPSQLAAVPRQRLEVD